MKVRQATVSDMVAWVDLRARLWPDTSNSTHQDEAAALLTTAPTDSVAFMALTDQGAAGFAEATVRRDYVNGCDTSPVAFLEGIYVRPDMHGTGIGRALVDAVQSWARSRDCSELASDAALDNTDSHAFHRATGFAETERVVFFRKRL